MRKKWNTSHKRKKIKKNLKKTKTRNKIKRKLLAKKKYYKKKKKSKKIIKNTKKTMKKKKSLAKKTRNKMRGGAESKESVKIPNNLCVTMISGHGFEGKDTYELKENQYVIMSSIENKRLWLSEDFGKLVVDSFNKKYDIKKIINILNSKKGTDWRIDKHKGNGKFQLYGPNQEVSNLTFKFLPIKREFNAKDTFARGSANMSNSDEFEKYRKFIKLEPLDEVDYKKQVCKLCLNPNKSNNIKEVVKYFNKYRSVRDFFEKNNTGILFLPVCRQSI